MAGYCICTYLRTLLEERAKYQRENQDKFSKNAEEENFHAKRLNMSDTNYIAGLNQQSGGEEQGGSQDNDSGYGDKDSSITSEDSGTTMSSDISSSESSESETSEESSTDDQDRSWMRVALLNARSVYGESTAELRDIQEYHALDVFAIVETFQRESNIRETLREIAPDSEIFHYGQSTRRRGIATLVSRNLRSREIDRGAREIGNMYMEFQAVELHSDYWHQPILLMNLYRPPGSNRTDFEQFLKEFQRLLDQFSSYRSVLITGDFNVWDDCEEDRNTRDFQRVLDEYGLEQRVRGPTQRRGRHTLDLVIIRNVEIDDLNVQDDGVSDHFTVYFKAKPM